MLERHKHARPLNPMRICAFGIATFLAAMCIGSAVEAQDATPAPTQATASANHVDINNFDFAPMTLTITAGTQVTWTNHDDIPHTVVSGDSPPAFKSPALDTDDSFYFTFMKPGTYSYFCSVHPKMVGSIVVKAN